MHIIVTDTVKGTNQTIKCRKFLTKEIRQIAASTIASGKRYMINVMADSSKDIDFISTNFCNIPIPAFADKAVWAGDMALFIALNYPEES